MVKLSCDICHTEIKQDDNTIGKFAYAEPNYALNSSNPQIIGMKGIEYLLCAQCKKWMLTTMEEKGKEYGDKD